MRRLDEGRPQGCSLPFLHAGYRIDRARLWDLPQIARIEASVFPEPISLRRALRLWCRAGTRYVVARRGSRIAGYFGFEVGGPTAHVLANATHPDDRRRGLAGVLLATGECLARPLGARWFLGEVRWSNTAQLRVLGAGGWRVVGSCRRFFGNGEDAHIVLRCFSPVETVCSTPGPAADA